MKTILLTLAFSWLALVIILLLYRLIKKEIFARSRENIGMCINGILLTFMFSITRDESYIPFINIPLMITFIVLLCIIVYKTRKQSKTPSQ